MGIFQLLKELFETLFLSASPEVQQKQQLKKLEGELRAIQPQIYKNGLLQPNFAEAIRLLYVHTKPLDNLFSSTIISEDVKRNERFMDKLVISGFAPEEQNILENLTYEKRKAAISESDSSPMKVFETQRKNMNRLVSLLSTQEFLKIDVILADLIQLTDFCRFNFVSLLTAFDSNFSGLIPDYKPSFNPIEPKEIEKLLADLYFLSGNLKITNSVANAAVALIQIKKGDLPSEQEKSFILNHLKSILYILNHILTAQTLKSIIFIAQQNPNAILSLASYKSSARQKFSARFQEQFEADERRIKQDLKDETTNSEINQLFGANPLEPLTGYSTSLNNMLQNNSPFSFMWIRPLEIIKSFLNIYLTPSIISLLKDIVIEGFFNNPDYKSQFSSIVYACSDSLDHIKEFEAKFSTKGKYDTAMIEGYIRDSHKNSDFTKQLANLIETINSEAKEIVVSETSALFDLYNTVGDILIDAKKAKNEIIDNLKILLLSSRNRDSSDLLEQQYPSWKIFFEIMKNYAVFSMKNTQDKLAGTRKE